MDYKLFSAHENKITDVQGEEMEQEEVSEPRRKLKHN